MSEQKPDGDALTPEEQRLLAPYVTNTEGPVFALVNLPEVIKGALFSRYSRSTLGLRRLLLKEFIAQPESGFQALAGAEPGGAAATGLAIGRAQSFYDRILDGYGDDSIGELGGAHLALEEISMLAAKAVQDARIGGSPLEKSTRYVNFGDKVNGDYRFYREPTLMASPHREAYLELCRSLFDTYAELQQPVRESIQRRAARPAVASESAWQRAARARAYDALRGLLPAGTLTNMGVFGNGRFFEALLIKLRLAELRELNGLAESMQQELDQVIPSFIRRARPEHPHYAGFLEHERLQREQLRSLSHAAMPADGPLAAGAPGAALADHDPDAEERVLAALAFEGSHRPLPELRRWAAGLDNSARAAVFEQMAAQRLNRRHKPPRALELAFYTFDLVGDFGMYRDLHRHRMLTQQRQLLTTRHGYEVPQDVRDAGLSGRFAAAMEHAAQVHERIALNLPLQAQYAVPMAYRIRWSMHINLRALIWLTELRSAPQGHPAYRRMAQELYRRVAEVHPRFAPLFRFVDLTDPEGELALGRLDAEQKQEQRQQRKAQVPPSAL